MIYTYAAACVKILSDNQGNLQMERSRALPFHPTLLIFTTVTVAESFLPFPFPPFVAVICNALAPSAIFVGHNPVINIKHQSSFKSKTVFKIMWAETIHCLQV